MENTPQKKNFGISLLVLIIAGCLLLSAGLVTGGYFLLRAQRNYTPPEVTVAPTATLRTIVTSPQPTLLPGQATPTPDSNALPPSIAGQMDIIQAQVTSIRGLDLLTGLQRDMMSEEELKDVVVNEFFADYTPEDAVKDTLELSVFGLLEPDFDLLQFYLDLYSEQIAGYYDSETKEMYVVGGEFTGLERLTYSHEYTHVLQDQHYDLENGLNLNEDTCETEAEYCSAVKALVEGDASLTEQLWFLSNGTEQDRSDIINFQQTYSSPVYDSAPAFMKEDFLFPYQQGFDFANALYSRGKWAAVDAAFADPPVTTEQILHPEKYPDDKPVVVEIEDYVYDLGAGWSEYDRNVMGEWYTYLILGAGRSANIRLDQEDAKNAAAGWDGDTFLFLINEASSETAFIWLSTWETQKDSNEFFTASRDYGNARWGNSTESGSDMVSWNSEQEGRITMVRSGKNVLWAISQDEKVVDTYIPIVYLQGN